MLFLDREQQVFEQAAVQETCPHCGNSSPARRATINYLRFAFLPIMPLKRSYSVHCYHCCRSSGTDKPTPSMIPFLSLVNKFAGLVLLILALFYYQAWQDKAALEEQNILMTPQKFDHYFIDISLYQNEAVHQPRYKVAKVVSRDDTSIDIVLGNYEYRKKSQVVKAIRLDNLMINNYFSDTTHSIAVDTLPRLREQEVIYAAYRPENLALFGGIVMRPQLPKAFRPKLPNAINQEGINLYHLGFHKEAFTLFEQEAQKGDGWAMLNLAQMYRDGEGTERDLQLALHWSSQAVELQIPGADKDHRELCLALEACPAPE